MAPAPKTGTIAWHDLTVRDAPKVRDFYAGVLGWSSQVFEGDFNMFAAGGAEPVAGICHARGANAHLPPQWLIYVVVEDLDSRVKAVTELGGRIVDGPRSAGTGRICVISDPAGAVMALFDPGKATSTA